MPSLFLFFGIPIKIYGQQYEVAVSHWNEK